MLKTVRKVVVRFILSLLILILVVLVTLNIPFDFYRQETSATDYSDWMSETLTDSQRVIDIAMLGAHDAFTAEISYGSAIDENSASSIQTGITGALIKGFSVKQTKTQVADAASLLKAGVRYFDIRLSYLEKEETWYTSHAIFSSPFADTLAEIETFLSDHPGEFLILDIQHVYTGDKTEAEAFLEIQTLIADSGIIERAFSTGTKLLSEVTYGDVTSSGTAGGVLLFTKLENEDDAFWPYGVAIRSAWPDTDSADTAFAFLGEEAESIADGTALTGNQMAINPDAQDSRQGLRVMQAVLTMQMSGSGILKAVLDWSLLSRAREFNSSLIDQADFTAWLAQMPIVMVDYSTTNYEEFNDRIMEILKEFNQ